MTASAATTWADLFPAGRDLFYEGDDPDEFAKEMAEKFGLDPRADQRWWEVVPGDSDMEAFVAYRFHCPAGLLDAIYGNAAYPLGS